VKGRRNHRRRVRRRPTPRRPYRTQRGHRRRPRRRYPTLVLKPNRPRAGKLHRQQKKAAPPSRLQLQAPHLRGRKVGHRPGRRAKVAKVAKEVDHPLKGGLRHPRGPHQARRRAKRHLTADHPLGGDLRLQGKGAHRGKVEKGDLLGKVARAGLRQQLRNWSSSNRPKKEKRLIRNRPMHQSLCTELQEAARHRPEVHQGSGRRLNNSK